MSEFLYFRVPGPAGNNRRGYQEDNILRGQGREGGQGDQVLQAH
jgi:hypothetical protein